MLAESIAEEIDTLLGRPALFTTGALISITGYPVWKITRRICKLHRWDEL
jgi:hypothetical protein